MAATSGVAFSPFHSPSQPIHASHTSTFTSSPFAPPSSSSTTSPSTVDPMNHSWSSLHARYASLQQSHDALEIDRLQLATQLRLVQNQLEMTVNMMTMGGTTPLSSPNAKRKRNVTSSTPTVQEGDGESDNEQDDEHPVEGDEEVKQSESNQESSADHDSAAGHPPVPDSASSHEDDTSLPDHSSVISAGLTSSSVPMHPSLHHRLHDLEGLVASLRSQLVTQTAMEAAQEHVLKKAIQNLHEELRQKENEVQSWKRIADTKRSLGSALPSALHTPQLGRSRRPSTTEHHLHSHLSTPALLNVVRDAAEATRQYSAHKTSAKDGERSGAGSHGTTAHQPKPDPLQASRSHDPIPNFAVASSSPLAPISSSSSPSTAPVVSSSMDSSVGSVIHEIRGIKRSTRSWLIFLFLLQSLFVFAWFMLTNGGSSVLSDHPLILHLSELLDPFSMARVRFLS